MKFFIFAGAAIILSLLTAASIAIPLCNAQNGNSQDFMPSRFVIMATQVTVFSPMNDQHEPQNVIVKLDTHTGKTWILQLDVAGGNDPKVRRSSWLELGNHR